MAWTEADLADPTVPGLERAAVAGSPLRHVGQPEEVAEVIVLLASHQARHLTGQVIRMA